MDWWNSLERTCSTAQRYPTGWCVKAEAQDEIRTLYVLKQCVFVPFLKYPYFYWSKWITSSTSDNHVSLILCTGVSPLWSVLVLTTHPPSHNEEQIQLLSVPTIGIEVCRLHIVDTRRAEGSVRSIRESTIWWWWDVCQLVLIRNTEHLSTLPFVSSRVAVGVIIRLESQMTADIQAILQLLQRQTTAGPPAYSIVTSSPEYQRPAIRVQPVSAIQTELSLCPAPPRPQVPTQRELTRHTPVQNSRQKSLDSKSHTEHEMISEMKLGNTWHRISLGYEHLVIQDKQLIRSFKIIISWSPNMFIDAF